MLDCVHGVAQAAPVRARRPLLSALEAGAESGVGARALSVGLLHVDREAGAGLRRHLAWRPGVALFLARLLGDLGASATRPDGSFLRSRRGRGAGVELC